MTKIVVRTIGDSTIDNGYWLLNKDGSNFEYAADNCVEGRLQSTLGDGYRVVSHAIDGFTTSSVLEGDFVGRVLGMNDRAVLNDKDLVYLSLKNVSDSDRFIRPLADLEKAVNENPDDIHYVVLSVGGNDFRERLGNPLKMITEIPNILKRYSQIVDRISNLGSKNIRPIIMTQYRLDVNNDCNGIYYIMKKVGQVFKAIHALSFAATVLSAVATVARIVNPVAGAVFTILAGGCFYLSSRVIPLNVWQRERAGQDLALATLSGLMENFYKSILEQAKHNNIPVLDLSNTFDPNADLYTSQIEPNAKGGALIAEGIAHIILSHNYDEQPSMLYAKKPGEVSYQASENPGNQGWRVG